jgi:hypothetical protein
MVVNLVQLERDFRGNVLSKSEELLRQFVPSLCLKMSSLAI